LGHEPVTSRTNAEEKRPKIGSEGRRPGLIPAG
jgi:hypothetical protein